MRFRFVAMCAWSIDMSVVRAHSGEFDVGALVGGLGVE